MATQSTPEGIVEYAWDAESRLVGIERPNQVSSSFEYDALGQVTRVRHETPEPESVPVVEPAPEPLLTDAVECRAVGSYLAERQAPMAGGQKPCVKTWDYLERRTLPEVESPVPAGASLEYTYEYDAAGAVTDSVRTITGPEISEPSVPVQPSVPEPVEGAGAPSAPSAPDASSVPEPVEGPDPTQSVETLTHAFTYDNLGRLTRSEASDGETNTYGYDEAGNRTSWNINGAEAGSSKQTAVFNEAGQLTSTTTTGANAGSASYTFDGAGNRSSQTVNGTATSFGHDPAGRLLSTLTEGRSTSYTSDGLDRRTSVTDATAFGSDTTSTTWDGLDPVATDSAQHGVTDLLRDPTGEVVFQSGAYDDAWVLGDARNATATADAGGRITDLVDYADFGAAGFESTGWASLVGNDGQPGDATLGLDHYYARDYDTATGSWVQPDQWRGLLVRPQSLNRFAYVENSPVSFSDYLGFLPIGGGLKGGVAKAYAKHAMKKGGIAAAVSVISKARGPQLGHKVTPGGAAKPHAKGPAARSMRFMADRHVQMAMDKCSIFELFCQRPGGRETVYCSDNILGTIAPATCTMDFRPETIAGKALEMLFGGAVGLAGGIISRALVRAIQAQAARAAAAQVAKEAAGKAAAEAAERVAKEAAKEAAAASAEDAAKRYLLAQNTDRWGHIMDPKHNWDRLATTKGEIADLMAKARANGTPTRSPKGHVDYSWHYKGEEIVVRVGPGGQISNGWIPD